MYILKNIYNKMYYFWDFVIVLAFISAVGWIANRIINEDDENYDYDEYIEYKHRT